MVVHTVPLRVVVARPELGLTVLCGEDELDRPVLWAHVSELADPTPFLVGGELLMTAGVKFPADVRRYVAGLVEAGVSAIGFGVMPEYDEVPATLIEACREQGMPLVAVPPDTPFLAVSQALGAELAEIQNAELRLLADSQRALTRAAVRLRPVDGTLATLASSLDCWVLLLDADGAVLGQAGRAPGVSRDMTQLAKRVGAGTGPRSAGMEIGADHVVLNPIEQVSARPSILVVGRERPLSVAERAVIAVALALLSLLRRDVDTSRGHSARLATRLLLGGESSRPLLALLLDNRASQRYRVVAGQGKADYETLVWELGTPLVDTGDGGFRAVLPASAEPDFDRHGWLAGVSAAVDADELRDAEREAEALLRRARVRGRSMWAVDGRETVSSLVDPVQAERFAVRLLAPVADQPHLVETLRAWLALHGNWDRSAAALGIHRNSVRHRIAHIERLLGIDLSEVETRTDLWHAVNWLPAN